MSTLQQALDYVRANPHDFFQQVQTHVELSGLAVVIAMLLCVPLGVLASRSRLASLYALNAVGIARAIPSIAIIFLAYPALGTGFRPALLALIILAFPPILVNTNVGFRGIDPAIREAAYGMGMSTLQVLRGIEFPLALPVVIAGIRTASVEVVASASLATFIGGGGLGDSITEGLNSGKNNILLAGALAIALLTFLADFLLGGVERFSRRQAG